MENVISVVGAAIVVSVFGAFALFERPEIMKVPGAVMLNIQENQRRD